MSASEGIAGGGRWPELASTWALTVEISGSELRLAAGSPSSWRLAADRSLLPEMRRSARSIAEPAGLGAGPAPFVYQLAHSVALPARDDAEAWASFLFPVVLEVPRNAGRVSVVVVEPASGIWGGAIEEPVFRGTSTPGNGPLPPRLPEFRSGKVDGQHEIHFHSTRDLRQLWLSA